MKKTLEKRLQLLESKHRPGEPKTGFYLLELGFLLYFMKRWPDPDAAPRFLRAEYNRLQERPKGGARAQ